MNVRIEFLISKGPLFRILTLPLLLLLCLGLVGKQAPVSARGQTSWWTLSEMDSYTGPAISGHGDGQLYTVAIAHSGVVAYSYTDSPFGWSSWEMIGPSSLYANPHTPPVAFREANTLHLFVRGRDDNLYTSSKVGHGRWADWQQLTYDQSITGRLSIVLSGADPEGGSLHVVSRGPNNSVEYRRFTGGALNWRQAGSTEQWNNAEEAVVGTDGSGQLLLVIRTMGGQLDLYRKNSPWSSAWYYENAISAGGPYGYFFDLSSVVYFGDAFHVVYAVKYLADDVSDYYGHRLQHLRYVSAYDNEVRTVTDYETQIRDPDGNVLGTGHPLAELALYRNKLVLAYRDAWGWVHYARWDNADPAGPWVGHGITDASRRTEHRPALTTHNRRYYLKGDDWKVANFGHDLFAAITELNSNSVVYSNFSRSIFLQELDRQFKFYQSKTNNVCQRADRDPKELLPEQVEYPGQGGRPFFTEVGYVLWTYPDWLVHDLFKRIGTIGCEEGNKSGRFDPPCSKARYPIIIFKSGRASICSGIWVGQSSDYNQDIWHELAHTMLSHILGQSDSNNEPPTSLHQQRSGIALGALQEAYNLFGAGINPDCEPNDPNDTCPDDRAPGFTGYGGNYDMSSRQHSFMGVLYYYFTDGDQLRRWVLEDRERGDNLLQQKYDWIRWHIYRGVEFGQHNAPVTSYSY
jgi:hypothetical protein